MKRAALYILVVLSGPGFFQTVAVAQVSHPEVLVVYNTNYPDSLSVANRYMAQRNIPSGNLCAITPPAADNISLSNYLTYVKAPVQSCLNAVGPKSILYIVLSYLTPFSISGTAPMDNAALDSYLGDVWDKYITQPVLIVPNIPQGYYADSQSQGGSYQAFMPLATYRANPRSMLIYSVWRLDGPSAAIASALVDQAMQAEAAGGPAGQACIDAQYDNIPNLYDASYNTGEWDLYQAATILSQAGITVVEDGNSAEFGTPPAPLTCPNTAFYSGWYSYNNYNDAFTWQTGAIGWHLDSASALNPREGSSWVPNALSRGITVTSGSVGEPYLEGLVRPGGTFRNLLEGATVGEAFLRNTRWLKWMILYVGDPLYRPFGTGRAPFSPLQAVNSFNLTQREIVGGKPSTATLMLSAPAPAGGTTFALDAGGSSLVILPGSVTVAAGATKATFTIASAAVPGSVPTVVTAIGGAVTLRNTLILDPLLGALVTSPLFTSAGIPVTGNVVLSGTAPTGGAIVTLTSDNAAVSVPDSVTVPAGTQVVTFTLTTVPVPAATTVHVQASYGGSITGSVIYLVPAINYIAFAYPTILAGGSTALAIYLGTPAPPGGATVQLSCSDPAALPVPATVVVGAGSLYGYVGLVSSPTSSGTSPTITATYGAATATATLTID